MKRSNRARSERPRTRKRGQGKKRFAAEEREFEALMEVIDRYEKSPKVEVEPSEIKRLLDRYAELREAGHGPQPYPRRG